MRIFNKYRIAYFDELGEDPDVQKTLGRIDISNRFIGQLDGTVRGNGNYWIEREIAKIPELKLGNIAYGYGSYVESIGGNMGWMRIGPPSDKNICYINFMGNTNSLNPEIASGRAAFWDTKSKRIIFISKEIVDQFSDLQFKQDFLEKLAYAIDNEKETISL